MADIADWSPVDESNTAAPPHGWPENQRPSSVNNCARAMMGAVRRWHDVVTVQFGNYLPLSGGTISGGLVVTGGISVQGIELSNLLGSLYVHNPAGGGGISVDGSSAGYGFADRGGGDVASSWVWYANAGSAHLARLDGGDVITATLGQVSIIGHLSATSLSVGSLSVTSLSVADDIVAGDIIQGRVVNATYIQSTGNLAANGSVSAAFVDSSGGIDADGNINAGGHITASGTVSGNALSANNANVGAIAATSVNATAITAGAGGLHSTNGISTSDVLGGQSFALFTAGATSYFQYLDQSGNANRWEWDGTTGDSQWRSLNAVHWVMRRSIDSMCFNSIGPVGGNGAYYNFSDRRFKEDIEPAGCGLDAVLRLNPVAFRRVGQDYREVGFIAQELRDVLPSAVRVVGIELPDGSGGPDDEPTLGMADTPILAAMVNAIKELSQRIQTLEGNHV